MHQPAPFAIVPAASRRRFVSSPRYSDHWKQCASAKRPYVALLLRGGRAAVLVDAYTCRENFAPDLNAAILDRIRAAGAALLALGPSIIETAPIPADSARAIAADIARMVEAGREG